MSVLIGSARSSFGSPQNGDQTGKEVSTQNFYLPSCGYWLGFKLKNKGLAIKLANAMNDACHNNNIGYSQPYRMTGRAAYIKAGSIKKMDLCCVDCSSLVNLLLYSIDIILPNFNTATEPYVLRKSGLFDEVKVKKESDCETGMILVTPTKGHTVVVISALFTEEEVKPIDKIVDEVIAGKWGNGNTRKSKLIKAGYDYDVIRKKVNEKLKGK